MKKNLHGQKMEREIEMQNYRETMVTKTVTEREYINTVCDRCGKVIPDEGQYDTREFWLRFTIGESYGNDGGNASGWEIDDLCDDCVTDLKTILTKHRFPLSPVELRW